MRAFFLSLLAWCLAAPALASQSLPVDTGKVTASLVSSHDSVAPGQSFHVALRTELDDLWHTYWRNPGDSGEPVQINWQLPQGVTAGAINWPLPRTIPTGPIVNYGFEGAPLFPVKFTVDPSVESGSVITIVSEFYYLVCKDVCIPEQGSVSLPIAIGESVEDIGWKTEIDAALAATPKRGDIQGAIQKSGTALEMSFTDLPSGDFSKAYFFPYEQGILGHSEPQLITRGSDGLKLTTTPDYIWDNDVPDMFEGVLTYIEGGQLKGTEVALAVGQSLDIGAAALPKASAGGVTLWTAIIGALIGGLILNLMPCVFPVISIKALSIAKSAHGERSKIKREAWLYTAGVIATFMLLTLFILGLKAGGAEIGWGFQLQSPKVVAALAVLLFVIGLNLLGAFEFGSSLQNTGAELTQKSGAAGSFFTGALAVIVATPCTAPLMAGAVGYALAAPAFVTLVVFLALAIGFALPFLLIAYVPGLLSKLPKPGPWMVRFKEVLAFPMFAAAIWLVWVLSLQAGEDGVLIALSAMLAVGLAVWCFKSKTLISKVIGAAAVLAAIVFPLTVTTSGASSEIISTKVNAESWSPSRVAELQAEGRSIFVDFTAAWCVTCKVNEKLVLNQAETQKLFTETNTAFLIADWTNKDDVIAAELAKYGRAGVPLYLVYSNNSVSPAILPQVLTYDVIKDAIAGE
ncbi:protein-disulfide reductase DsbD family protein [Hellea balneolensis]|uniref:protein-disulfide reductase DsbD family protein n=1 Tax=Hellea balneolensis TaxID=287478 RepID=UPI000429C37C|nr:thioredoxin family protein [Hellea balneolensis]